MTTPYPLEQPRNLLEVDRFLSDSTSPAEVLELVAHALEAEEVE